MNFRKRGCWSPNAHRLCVGCSTASRATPDGALAGSAAGRQASSSLGPATDLFDRAGQLKRELQEDPREIDHLAGLLRGAFHLVGRSVAISADDGGPVLQGGGDDALVEQVRNTGIESIAVFSTSKMPYRSF